MPTLLSDQSQGYTLHHNGSPYCANSTIRPVTEIHPKLQWIPIPCQLHYNINHRYIPCPGEAKMSTSRLSLMTKALPPPCTMLWGCGHNRFSFSSVTTGLRGLHAAMSRSNVASFWKSESASPSQPFWEEPDAIKFVKSQIWPISKTAKSTSPSLLVLGDTVDIMSRSNEASSRNSESLILHLHKHHFEGTECHKVKVKHGPFLKQQVCYSTIGR